MKKIIAVFLVCMLGTTLVSTSVYAKGKPEEAGKNRGNKQIQVRVDGEEQQTQETTENEAKNRGQQKKLEERIKVRGMNMKFDVPPVIKEGRTLVPVRAIMNGLGADVEWDSEAQKVTITLNDKVIVIDMATGEINVNGEAVEVDVPAQNISNRTFVPLRFIAETLGEKVVYDEETGDIDIGDEADPDEDTEQTDPNEDTEQADDVTSDTVN